ICPARNSSSATRTHRPPAAAGLRSPSDRPPLPDSSERAWGEDSGVIAAVDLGSNSFHIVVARAYEGRLAILDRLREMVRLASGLDDRGELDGQSQQRALECLKRFGQRLRDMDAHRVRVVGTSALRRARNAEAFIAAAEDAL